MTIKAPIRPTITALQRRRPTVSPGSGIASMVSSSGATKLIAVASASGMNRSAVKKKAVAASSSSERTICSVRCLVRATRIGLTRPTIIGSSAIEKK